MKNQVLIVNIKNTTNQHLKDIFVFSNKNENVKIDFELRTNIFPESLESFKVERIFLETNRVDFILGGMELINCFEDVPVKKIYATIDPCGLNEKSITINEEFFFNSESNIMFGFLPKKSKVRLELIIDFPTDSATKQFLN